MWSGFSIIVNIKTILHHDTGAAPTDYDFLVSSGLHKQCVLDVQELGLKLSYPSGTGVAIVSRVLRHGFKTWEGGERICKVLFMKVTVHDWDSPDQIEFIIYSMPDISINHGIVMSKLFDNS